MSNIIRLNETAPNDEWIIMSNQGTDCFLDLLITAAEDFEKTEQQQKLISFLKDQKDINTVAPGTAGFDLDEMAWQESTLKEDVEFLIRVTKEAQRERSFRKLPYEINTGIVIPWLERFVLLIDQMTAENLHVKSEFTWGDNMNKAGTQKIETDRLKLRRFKLEDAKDMYENWASDSEVTRFLTWPSHTSVDVTKSLLSDWIPKYEDGGYFNWVMEYKKTGKAIGNISVVKLNENIKSADMGYCMSRAYWGQGLMTEALIAVMDYLFDVVGLNRVAACHDANNPKSGRVMEKAGMKQEGILRAAGKNNLGICDEVWHAMIRSDRE